MRHCLHQHFAERVGLIDWEALSVLTILLVTLQHSAFGIDQLCLQLGHLESRTLFIQSNFEVVLEHESFVFSTRGYRNSGRRTHVGLQGGLFVLDDPHPFAEHPFPERLAFLHLRLSVQQGLLDLLELRSISLTELL